ncbi:MAG: arsenical resistance protein ArsH [Paracoccus sp. (in: a-proteobacteria)]|uniref:arsenical resistance protein ArsH n=1 Tax=Paracoccus sp. TaxID=267 RepID=UPI0026DF3A05|nr:arsenical resistance protein ArsH [Paracoccus sp. (in: a-proteobacteria)]MDO5613185.1 arsenical resistance protein ArsH [Paracoccus sp. (in: a-proteobacteria)]
MRLRHLPDPHHLPALEPGRFRPRPAAGLGPDDPPVRVLLLYGSLRRLSYSRLAAEEAARLLIAMGAEVRLFDPADLPFPDQHADGHPAIAELHEHVLWSDAMIWSSPETHGQMSGLMKAQIDHIPLNIGAIRPTQGRCLALMQVCGGSQSFNALNAMRVMGRWMRMFTIPNQSSVARAHAEFDENGRMRASPCYDRIVDVAEELIRFTVLTRPHRDQLADRYSERPAAG